MPGCGETLSPSAARTPPQLTGARARTGPAGRSSTCAACAASSSTPPTPSGPTPGPCPELCPIDERIKSFLIVHCCSSLPLHHRIPNLILCLKADTSLHVPTCYKGDQKRHCLLYQHTIIHPPPPPNNVLIPAAWLWGLEVGTNFAQIHNVKHASRTDVICRGNKRIKVRHQRRKIKAILSKLQRIDKCYPTWIGKRTRAAEYS